MTNPQPLITHPLAPGPDEVIAVMARAREMIAAGERGDRGAVFRLAPSDHSSLYALATELAWIAGGMVHASGRPTDRMLRKTYGAQEGRSFPRGHGQGAAS
jgi:hypothetical protein